MKKFSYIVLVALLVVVSSCNKEVITPSGSSTVNRPSWVSDDASNTGNGKSSSSDKALSDDDGEDVIITDGTSSSGITDPNKDPDANKHKGGRGKK